MKSVLYALVFVAAVRAQAAISYHFQTTTNGAASTLSSGRVLADTGRMRIDFDHGDGLVFRDTSVVLSSDGGRTLTILDPKTRTFTTMKMDEILAGPSALFSMSYANARTSTRDLGDGGAIEGYPTRRTALDADYDMIFDVAGRKVITHITMHVESWRTTRIPESVTSVLELKGFHTGVAAIDKVIEASGAAKGFPLKAVSTVRSKEEGGREMAVTSTTLVREVRSVTATPAQFAIPAGYRRRQ